MTTHNHNGGALPNAQNPGAGQAQNPAGAQSAHNYAVIMCGGIGSRFWPRSRSHNPKQFIDFFGMGRSLLQMTYDRLLPLVPAQNIVVVTNSQYASLVRSQLPDVDPANVLLEPARRNTAPCIAWATRHIMARDAQAVVLVTPSDHLITREAEFQRAVTQGLRYVSQNPALLTMGITPTRPETGYGYIQAGTGVEGDIFKVKTFTEKPDLALAEVFLSTGEFYWNSGLFMWRADTIMKAFAEHAPEVDAVFAAGGDVYGTPGEENFIAKAFASCPSISIDYAVMEKATNVCVETVAFNWSDLGTWGSLYDNSPKNRNGNVTQNCNVLEYDCSGNIIAVSQTDKLLVVDGLKDFIVADAGDVLLICPRAKEQGIRQMVLDAKAKYGEKFQ